MVVFGAWATWTDDYEKYARAPEEYNFCAYQPMMFAVVILIIKWVLIPALIAFSCFCTTCCGFLSGQECCSESTAYIAYILHFAVYIYCAVTKLHQKIN